jgi:hypothetical protein
MLLKSARTWAAFGEHVYPFFFLTVDFCCSLSIYDLLFAEHSSSDFCTTERESTTTTRLQASTWRTMVRHYTVSYLCLYLTILLCRYDRCHGRTCAPFQFLRFFPNFWSHYSFPDMQRLAARLLHICTVIAHNCSTTVYFLSWSMVNITNIHMHRPLLNARLGTSHLLALASDTLIPSRESLFGTT